MGCKLRTMNQKEFLTPEEAATLLRVTRRTVYAWLKTGKLPALHIGSTWRIRLSDLIPKPDNQDKAA